MNSVVRLTGVFNIIEPNNSLANKLMYPILHVKFVNRSDIVLKNEEMNNFIYPALIDYTEEDRLNKLNTHFNIDCKTIQNFGPDIEMDDTIIIRLLNNIWKKEVIDSVSNLTNYYKEVYICNLFYDNPALNIHYVVAKNKEQDIDKFAIYNGYNTINDNEDIIHDYLVLFLISLLILMKLFVFNGGDKPLYTGYCNFFATS